MHMPCWMQNSTTMWLLGCVSGLNNRRTYMLAPHCDQILESKFPNNAPKGATEVFTYKVMLFTVAW